MFVREEWRQVEQCTASSAQFGCSGERGIVVLDVARKGDCRLMVGLHRVPWYPVIWAVISRTALHVDTIRHYPFWVLFLRETTIASTISASARAPLVNRLG